MHLMKLSRTLLALASTLLLSLTYSSSANATFSFSNISYSANSLTFTIDGDMSGYALSSVPSQFSVRFLGDIYNGPNSFTPNNLSASPFDNKPGSFGNLYKDAGTQAYSWNDFSSSLSDAYATANLVTISWSQNWLNTSALNPIVEFVWGNGHDGQHFIVLGDFVIGNDVPEPASLALLGIAVAGLGFSRRKSVQAA